MECHEVKERFFDAPTPELEQHLVTCQECAREFGSLRATMAAMDDWRAPGPSPFFNTRFNALLNEARQSGPTSRFAWLRQPLFGMPAWRPAMASALAVIMAVGIAVTYWNGQVESNGNRNIVIAEELKGTAVGDLMVLEKEQQLFTELELLDDLSGEESHQDDAI